MTKEELYNNVGYWLQGWQLQLYVQVAEYKPEDLTEKLNISLDTAKSILKGDYNGTISEFIEIFLKLGYWPNLQLIDGKEELLKSKQYGMS